MLPALNPDRMSLADVMPSCLAALTGQSNRLGLPAVTRAVVLLVDGLGAAALKARSGHARTLAGALTGSAVMDSGFPTTTASALATLTTGTSPGQHGLVGYSVLDGANDRVVNQLSGWDERIDPLLWQRQPTVFSRAEAEGVEVVAIGPERYRNSGFSAAVLRGATYRAASSIEDRLAAATAALREESAPRLLYVYVPELDMASHAYGWESGEWTNALEGLDGAVRSFVTQLRAGEGLLVTADHGVVDVAPHNHVLFDETPGLLEGIEHIAGEPRCLQLHFAQDASESLRATVVDRWRAAEGERSWVATRSEAIEAGWFGSVDPEVAPRIGDILVAARKAIAYYDGRAASAHGRSMVGQHGSWSPAELKIPLLRYGAFAR